MAAENSSKVLIRRASQWRIWLPGALLRAAYDDLAVPARAQARKSSTSHGSIQTARDCVAECFIEGQQRAMMAEIRRTGPLLDKHLWVTYALQWDESKFFLRTTDTPAGSDSLMTMHGVVRWMPDPGISRAEDVILTPAVLEDSTADTMAAAVDRAHELCAMPLSDILNSGMFTCLHPSSDAVAANARLVKWWLLSLPESTLILWTRCLQHQAALCLSPVTSFHGFLGSLFCTCKTYQQGDQLRIIRASLLQVLRVAMV